MDGDFSLVKMIVEDNILEISDDYIMQSRQ